MIGLVGIVVIFVMVFGGYLAAGGKIGIILHALPFELMMIGGAAIGAFLISNDAGAVKHTLRDIAKVFKGPKWQPEDYRDLLCLLFSLIRLGRQNPVAVEEHIEAPQDSAIFTKYPRILADREAVALIGDTLRSASMNYDDPHQVEEVLDKRMEASQHHALHSSHALQTMADGLPALGIVAAVLGVIKTMASIGPFASKVRDVVEEDAHFYKLIREVLVANLHNHAANICIEVGRQNTPAHKRPSFGDLEEALRALKQDAA
jgi:chemotaxis protein MotA